MVAIEAEPLAGYTSRRFCGSKQAADGEPLVAYYDDDPASDTYGLHVTQESKPMRWLRPISR